jgi:hypothetical protein
LVRLTTNELENALLSSSPTMQALASEVADHRADVSQLRPPRAAVSAKELAHQWFGRRNLRPGLSKRGAGTCDGDVQSLVSLIVRVRKESARQIARLVQEVEKLSAVNRVQKEWIDFNGPRLVALTELVRECREQLGHAAECAHEILDGEELQMVFDFNAEVDAKLEKLLGHRPSESANP